MRPIKIRILTFLKRIFSHALLFGLLGPLLLLGLGLFNHTELAKELISPAFHQVLLMTYLMYWGIATVWIFIEEILLDRKIQRAPMTYDWMGVPDPCEPVSDGLPTIEKH